MNKKINYKKLIFVIICLSFALKIIAGFYLKDSFLKRGNSHTPMNAIAVNLVESGSYQLLKGVPSIDYEPLYPSLMALSYKIFGMNWLGLTLFQGILFALSSWLLFLIGTSLMDERAGFIAVLYHSFYPYLFSYSLSIYDTTLFVFLYLLIVHLLIHQNENLYKYGMIGGVLGLALLTRGSVIAFIPIFFLYILLKSSKPFNLLLILKRFSTLGLFCLLVLSPWLLRNYQLTSKWIISVHGAYGLWQGNNEHSYDFQKEGISLDKIYLMKPLPRIYVEFPMNARPPREAIKVANAYRDEAISFIIKNPGKKIQLALLNFEKFWSWELNPITSTFQFGDNEKRKLVYSVSYLPLLLLMPFGMLILFKKNRMEFLLIFGIIFFYTLAHMIVIGFTRARLPIDCLLMLFFGFSRSFFFEKTIPSQ